MMDMRKGGMVVFINGHKGGDDFVLIRNLNDLQHYAISDGWDSIEDFEAGTGYDKEQLIGKAVCYTGAKLYLLEDEDWFPTLDKARMNAVFNKYVLDSDKLSVEEAGDVIVDCFYGICGVMISLDIKEIVDRRVIIDSEEETDYFVDKVKHLIINHIHITS